MWMQYKRSLKSGSSIIHYMMGMHKYILRWVFADWMDAYGYMAGVK